MLDYKIPCFSINDLHLNWYRFLFSIKKRFDLFDNWFLSSFLNVCDRNLIYNKRLIVFSPFLSSIFWKLIIKRLFFFCAFKFILLHFNKLFPQHRGRHSFKYFFISASKSLLRVKPRQKNLVYSMKQGKTFLASVLATSGVLKTLSEMKRLLRCMFYICTF